MKIQYLYTEFCIRVHFSDKRNPEKRKKKAQNVIVLSKVDPKMQSRYCKRNTAQKQPLSAQEKNKDQAAYTPAPGVQAGTQLHPLREAAGLEEKPSTPSDCHHPPQRASWDCCVPAHHSQLPSNSKVTFQKLISSAGAQMHKQ